MAATKKVLAGIESMLGHGEALGRDAIGWVESGIEDGGIAQYCEEETKKRGFPVVSTESFDELGVAEDAAPSRADEGSAGER